MPLEFHLGKSRIGLDLRKIVQTIAEFSIIKYAKFAGLGAINHLPKIRSISHNRDFRVRRSS